MYKEKFNEWLNSAVIAEEVKEELRSITDEKELEDRFYKDLDFGTGGLRGVIGFGSNRMNVYTVSKATQGFANYLIKALKSHQWQLHMTQETCQRNLLKQLL